jgi:hypothetical protein
MRATSDIFLGWFRGTEGHDFYWRQLEGTKGSAKILLVPRLQPGDHFRPAATARQDPQSLYTSPEMEKLYPLIEHYGYLIVFFSIMLGTAGILFPTASVLLASGVLVQQGHLNLAAAIAFGVLGGHRGQPDRLLGWPQVRKSVPLEVGTLR